MRRSPGELEPLRFSHLFLLALDATGVSRSDVARACGVVPRTAARWADGDCEPSVAVKTTIVHRLYDSRRLPKALLDKLCEDIGQAAWQLGLEAPPAPVFTPSPATQKVLDDVVREAAEELSVDPRALRPVLSRVFAELVRYEIPVGAAVGMVVRR
jgi:hypothetical protein